MEQARSYICKACSSAVPLGHRYCGSCGAEVPDEIQKGDTDFFSSMQTPGRARLVLIRGGDGRSGANYLLQGDRHVIGSGDVDIAFPQDATLSKEHANFGYRNGQLVVFDRDSVNGVFVRIHDSVPVDFGSYFICGEQLLRIDKPPMHDGAQRRDDGTYFYASPMWTSSFRVTQLLGGGGTGMVFCARENRVEIGRADADMNFPMDVYMSTQHASIEKTSEGRLMLTDRGSKNGTYLRIVGEQALQNGDYVFVGRQLLRVEMHA